MNNANIRMVESRSCARLLLKATHSPVVAGKIEWQKFERDLSTQPRVPREIDFTHPAGAQRRQNRVGADFLTGYKLHFLIGQDSRHQLVCRRAEKVFIGLVGRQ